MQRDQKTQAKYQKTLAKIEGCPLCWRLKQKERIIRTKNFTIIKSDFPYKEIGGRKVKFHQIMIANKCAPIGYELDKMFEAAINYKPDSIIINQDHHASVPDHFHIHLIWTSKNTKTKPKSLPTTH